MDTPVFQTAQDANFNNILALYGQDCIWNGITGSVLFNDPTKQQRFNITSGRGLSHVGYDNADIIQSYIEYPNGQFPGLFELVYSGEVNQYIITGGKRYVCQKSTSFFDGQTYRINLQPAISDLLVPET